MQLLFRKEKEEYSNIMIEKKIKQTTCNENIGLICNTIIFCVAFINPWLALALSFTMWVYWLGFA